MPPEDNPAAKVQITKEEALAGRLPIGGEQGQDLPPDGSVTYEHHMESLVNQRRTLCEMHDADIVELARVRKVAAGEIARLEAELAEAKANLASFTDSSGPPPKVVREERDKLREELAEARRERDEALALYAPFRPMTAEQAEAEIVAVEAEMERDGYEPISDEKVEHAVNYATNTEYRAKYLDRQYIRQSRANRGLRTILAAVDMILDSMNAPKYAAGGEGDAEVEMNVLDRLRAVQRKLSTPHKFKNHSLEP